MDLQEQIKAADPKTVINDNEQFANWINENVSLDEAIRRCPSILLDLLEEYNNDWIEAVESAAEEIGLTLDDDFEIVSEDDEDEWEEDEEDQN